MRMPDSFEVSRAIGRIENPISRHCVIDSYEDDVATLVAYAKAMMRIERIVGDVAKQSEAHLKDAFREFYEMGLNESAKPRKRKRGLANAEV